MPSPPRVATQWSNRLHRLVRSVPLHRLHGAIQGGGESLRVEAESVQPPRALLIEGPHQHRCVQGREDDVGVVRIKESGEKVDCCE